MSNGRTCAVTNDWKAQTPVGREKAMLYNKQVPISESALLVIDAQDSFKVSDRWVRRNNKDFETNIGRLVELYRQHRLPVIYFLHSDDDPGFERHSKHYKLMDFLAPLASEPVLHKDTRNVFTSTGLPALLMEKGCETSARLAAAVGYAVDFVTEATMTFPIPNHDKPGEELDVDAIRERTEYALRRRFATIATVDSIARELGLLRNPRVCVEQSDPTAFKQSG